MHNNLCFIHYPSGGYGFYLTRLINRYVSGIVKVDDDFSFDDLGTSHSLPLVYGDLHFNKIKNFNILAADVKYHCSIQQGDISLVPCCPGINSDLIPTTLNQYPNSLFLRLWYDDQTWPLVFYNAIHKAMQGNIDKDVEFNANLFDSCDDWAYRENFSLLCKNHNLRNEWKVVDHPRVHNINILSLLSNPIDCIKDIANFLNLSTDLFDIDQKHRLFLNSNLGTVTHLKILDLVDNLTIDRQLSWIKELFWQGVFNFYVEKKYQITIPANCYSNWFTSTKNVVKMLKEQGVIVDSNKKSDR